MTIYVKCDECGRMDEIIEYRIPKGWDYVVWDDLLMMHVKEKHYCPDCCRKIREAKE